MKQSTAACILTFFIICGAAGIIKAQQPGYGNPVSGNKFNITQFKKNIERKMPAWLKTYHVPGAQVVLLSKWQIAYNGNFGWADEKAKKRVTGATVFPVASISKSLAAIGVVKLYDAGKIHLDSPYAKYVHSWQLPTSQFGETGITIRQLLSHTAGVSGRSANYYLNKSEVPTTIEELARGKNGIGAVVNTAAPGTKWNYSGGGYLMLQLLIEEVSRKSYDAYMKEEVFTPLGMKHSGYTPTGDNYSKRYDFNLKITPDTHFGNKAAAGLGSTATDLANFIILGLNKNKRFLKPDILKEAFAPSPVSGGAYSLGFYCSKPAEGWDLAGHDGAVPGIRAVFKFNPASGDGVIVLTNSSFGASVYNAVLDEWGTMATGAANPLFSNIYMNAANTIIATLYAEGLEKAKYLYTRKKQADRNTELTENYMSYWAYGLHEAGFGNDAVLLLQLNTFANPENINAFDSLGEICLMNHHKQEALKAYKRVLELDPENKTAKEKVARLTK